MEIIIVAQGLTVVHYGPQ